MKTLAKSMMALGSMALVGGTAVPSTAEEVLELVPLEFTGADEDEDGYINPEEAEAIPGLTAVFALLDRDQNGGIDMEEFGYVPSGGRRDHGV